MLLDSYPYLQIALKFVLAFFVFLIGRWLAGRFHLTLSKNLGKTKITPSMARLLILAAYYGFMLVVLIVSLAIAGVPLQPMLTVTLIILVVLGFALHSSLNNLAATVLFMLFEPFRVGELVETNGVMGVVKEIQLFSTVLITYDNKVIIIPNSNIQGNNLTNYNRLGFLRATLVFGVSYADDLTKVKAVLREIVTADSRVMTDPAPLIFVQSLGDSCVNVVARVAANPDDYWALQMEMPERVKVRFDAEGISIPFPQRDVHLYQHNTKDMLEE
jgi:small conductance mechanosensitive channel